MQSVSELRNPYYYNASMHAQFCKWACICPGEKDMVFDEQHELWQVPHGNTQLHTKFWLFYVRPRPNMRVQMIQKLTTMVFDITVSL